MLSCCIPTRQESNAKPLAACREALEPTLPIAAAKIDDAVAEARSVLQLIGKLPPCRGVHLDRGIGIEPFELRDLLLRRKRGHQAILEGAQHAARREVMWTLTALRRWCTASANVQKDFVGVCAIYLLVEVRKLGGHARIDLDDGDTIASRVVHHL